MDSKVVKAYGEEGSLYWYYNIEHETEWNQKDSSLSVSNPLQDKLVLQQEQQLLFIARPEDCVIIRNPIKNEFLEYLQEEGIDLPKIINLECLRQTIKKENNKVVLVPYIETEKLKSEFPSLKIGMMENNQFLVKKLNSKFHVRKMAIANQFDVTDGYFCYGTDELTRAYNELTRKGFKKVVFKAAYGSSGKGLIIIENQKRFDSLKKFIEKRNIKNEFLLEGWHNTQFALNGQLFINNDVHILAITQQRIDQFGVYKGTNFTPDFNGDLLEKYEFELKRLGNILKKIGYKGIVGIDSIYDYQNRLIPIIEINSRFTQVTYLLNLINKFKNMGYSFIESCILKFEVQSRVSFKQVKQQLETQLCTNAECGFLIYTFGKVDANNKSLLKIFFLFYSKNKNSLKNMLDAVKKINIKGEI
ncbi:hypothetical protein COJ27_29830 [Bacillus cereus]|uniref:ATP-grasp domain-containing protein n=1 Tax=Bacillus cereus TaxID=1396 RepID=UPI000BFA1C9B|nr:ATP-grasp domain-containing protein [Bacillus cereus]PFL57203.1 hypothetical protein COJ27_29830 [Bacillus cereus]